jgi:hypothetical protein
VTHPHFFETNLFDLWLNRPARYFQRRCLATERGPSVGLVQPGRTNVARDRMATQRPALWLAVADELRAEQCPHIEKSHEISYTVETE